ncbi:MAG: hypothetical protein N3G74_00080 [Candidatus Micrarchaeota archaeon]|nr:hypothetical protein [Candidatus Micrarchaeota archaeon]
METSFAWLRDKRVILVMFVAVAMLLLLYFKGASYGLEFTGGTRIPITLEKPVSKATMDEIVNTIKLRVSKFGLSQVVVRSVGDQQVYVELPASSDQAYIQQVKDILSSEGKFEAIIDGVTAITGENIVSGSIRDMTSANGSHIRWGVGFVVNQEGAKKFANAAYGKANYPVYLFLDKAEESVIIMRDIYLENITTSLSDVKEQLSVVASYGNNVVIFIDPHEDLDAQVSAVLLQNKSKVIVSEEENELILRLNSSGIKVIKKPISEMAPEVIDMGIEGITINQWSAIGLLSAPTLSPSLTTGQASQQFSIEGNAKGNTYQERQEHALAEVKRIKSILSGGALPVAIELGSIIYVPPSLGNEFLNYSILGMVVAGVIVLLFIAFRYRHPEHIFPLIFVATTQMIILISFMAVFGTLDLSTIAGLFGTLGTSVDYQIVITDEILGRSAGGRDEAKRRLDKAKYIISRDVGVLTVVMLPLMFSNIVEIIGFATATLLGSLIGLAITTLVYNAVIEKSYKE